MIIQNLTKTLMQSLNHRRNQSFKKLIQLTNQNRSQDISCQRQGKYSVIHQIPSKNALINLNLQKKMMKKN